MNESLVSKYKDIVTSRGLTYHYLSLPAVDDKPTLLFIHGFPSISYDWYHQINYFSKRGFGVVAPDMLGYGGTSKPTDMSFFLHTAIAQDLLDILDAEKVQKAIAVGHDWGAPIISVLSMKHSDRFLGFAWVVVTYQIYAPCPPIDVILEMNIKTFGRPLMGYWKFFEQESAPQIIEKNLESLISVLYPDDPDNWLTLMNQPGEIQAFVENGKTTKRASYLTDEHHSRLLESLRGGGLTSALNWYRSTLGGVNSRIMEEIPEENQFIKKPAFFAVARKDHVCVYDYAVPQMKKYATGGLHMVEFQGGHWVQLEEPETFNRELEGWIRDTLQQNC
ncbi:Alpha/Beta hydrolase protein [Suillus discolor]|uniref:Alpha/Beta hydrolase protein n=1 Tax=Suillus discolor TaxID=1912936 RepID=A0A9P7EV38_9AGAM|nr:Alpha/Beta hydrolase protein [Suillus discolor]KAG2089864.1 Alpha/Beta hydrolase protein [Suillus discolor]